MSATSSNRSSPSLRRTQQISDYVAKQKAAKLNAEQLRLTRAKQQEDRQFSAQSNRSESASSQRGGASREPEPQDEYNKEFDSLALENQSSRGNSAARISSNNASAATMNQQYNSNVQRLPSQPAAASSGYTAPRSMLPQPQSQPQFSSTMRPPQYPPPSGSAPSQQQQQQSNNRTANNNQNNDNPSSLVEELSQRVVDLESQVKLLKQQNRLFYQFMQATEQQMNDMKYNAQGQGGTQGAPMPRQQQQQQQQRQSNDSSATTAGTTSLSEHSDRLKEAKARELQRMNKLRDLKKNEAKQQSKSKYDEADEEEAAAEAERQRAQHPQQSANQTPVMQAKFIPQQQQQQRPAVQALAPNRQAPSQPQQQQQRNAQPQPQARQPAAAAAPQRQPPQQQQRQQVQRAEDDEFGEEEQEADEDEDQNGGQDDQDNDDGMPAEHADIETFPCPECGRRFAQHALSRHVAKKLCKAKPRKVFKVKIVDSELEAQLKQVKKGAAPAKKPASKWRAERARLQEAIQAGKEITAALAAGVNLRDIPVAVSAQPDDRVECAYCGRRFEAQTHERHVKHCKDTKARAKGPPQRPQPVAGRRK